MTPYSWSTIWNLILIDLRIMRSSIIPILIMQLPAMAIMVITARREPFVYCLFFLFYIMLYNHIVFIQKQKDWQSRCLLLPITKVETVLSRVIVLFTLFALPYLVMIPIIIAFRGSLFLFILLKFSLLGVCISLLATALLSLSFSLSISFRNSTTLQWFILLSGISPLVIPWIILTYSPMDDSAVDWFLGLETDIGYFMSLAAISAVAVFLFLLNFLLLKKGLNPGRISLFPEKNHV